MDASFDVSLIGLIFLDNFKELEISILFHWRWSDEILKICSYFSIKWKHHQAIQHSNLVG